MAPMPPMHHELVRIAKKRKIFNFFLPEVCGLSVSEYAPIQEILGTVRFSLCVNTLKPKLKHHTGTTSELRHELLCSGYG